MSCIDYHGTFPEQTHDPFSVKSDTKYSETCL